MVEYFVEAVDQTKKELLTVPFLAFPCGICNEQVVLVERLEPGQAAVIECGNCTTSWTVILQSLQVVRTENYEPVWKQLTA